MKRLNCFQSLGTYTSLLSLATLYDLSTEDTKYRILATASNLRLCRTLHQQLDCDAGGENDEILRLHHPYKRTQRVWTSLSPIPVTYQRPLYRQSGFRIHSRSLCVFPLYSSCAVM